MLRSTFLRYTHTAKRGHAGSGPRIGGRRRTLDVIVKISSLRSRIASARREGKSIGVVPTMGAFHEGHLALMRRAKAENDLAVVTLFVNPTQFNDPEDFAKYPRDDARDLMLAEAVGVDYILMPSPGEVYPEGFDTEVVVKGLSNRLEGKSRPGHFTGVSTVVAKLLNMVQADRAYFGEKDWQQLQIVTRLTADLDIPTRVVPCPIVRESDGLAMSSRNVRLTPEERVAAIVLSRALAEAAALADSGVRDAGRIARALHEAIAAEPLARMDYAVVVDPSTMLEIDTIDNGALAAVAAYFGKVRLIDNRLLLPKA